MLRSVSVLALVAAAWLMAGGCAAAPEVIQPHGSVTVTASATRKQTRATAQFANEVKFVLPPADPADYIWQIAVHDSRFLKQLTEVIPVTGPTHESTISFLAVHTGTTKVRFVLVPPTGMREIDPVNIHEFQLTIE